MWQYGGEAVALYFTAESNGTNEEEDYVGLKLWNSNKIYPLDSNISLNNIYLYRLKYKPKQYIDLSISLPWDSNINLNNIFFYNHL